MTLLASEEYVESGYFAATDYVGGIAQGQADTTTTYVEEGYVEAGYFRPGGSAFTLSATLTLAIEEGSATLSSIASLSAVIGTIESGAAQLDVVASTSATSGRIRSFSASVTGAFSPIMTVTTTADGNITLSSQFAMSVQGDRFRTADSLLTFQADLDAQAAKTVTSSASMPVTFTATHTVPGGFDLGFNVDANFDAASILTATSSLTISVDTVELAEADLTAEFDLYANAIEYRLRGTDRTENVRPLIPADSNLATSVFPTNTTIVKFGTYASQGLDNNLYYLEYQDSVLVPNNTDEWLFETFVVLSSVGPEGSNNELITIGPSNYTSQNDLTIRLEILSYQSSKKCRVVFADSNDVQDIEYGSTALTTVNKHHIVLAYKPGTGIKVWVDGSLDIDVSFTGDLRSITDPSVWFGYAGAQPGTINHLHWLDETRILQSSSAFSDAGITFANSSQTVPTSAYTSNSSTQLLLHYENNYRDDDVGIQLFESNQSSEFALTATPQKIISTSSNLAAITDLSSVIGRKKLFTVDLDATGSQLTAIGVIGSFFVNADVAANISTTAARLRTVDANISSVVNANINAGKITDTNANFTGAFTPTLTANVIVNDEVDIAVSTTLTATPTRVISYEANLNSTASMTATAFSIINFNADITSVSTQADTDFVRIRDANIHLDATGSQLVAVAKIAGLFVNADISANLSATGVVKTGTVIDFTILTNLNTDVGHLKGVVSNINSAFDATITSVLINKTFSSNITSTATLTATGAIKVFNLEQYYYTIPAENRSHTIAGETRSHSVARETRTYILEGT